MSRMETFCVCFVFFFLHFIRGLHSLPLAATLFPAETPVLFCELKIFTHPHIGIGEAVSLLSGRKCMPPGSSLTLARATLLLSDLRGMQSSTLLKLTQKLLKKQLCAFGQNVVLDDGKICFSPPGPTNIYLPYLSILDQTTLRIGHNLDVCTMEMPISAQSSQSSSSQHSNLSIQLETECQAPVLSLSN